MRAVVYPGPGRKAWDEVPDPEITDAGDIIVRVDAPTICGTDLHILKGDVPKVIPGRILGHEAVGTPATFELAVKLARPGGLDEFEAAYVAFARAADTSALKVVLSR